MTTPEKPDPSPDQAMKRMTRRAFATGAAAALAGYGGLSWLASRDADDGIPWPFRWWHRRNETVGRALFSPTHLAPEFDRALAGEPRVNGWIGHAANLPSARDWQLRVERPGQPERRVALPELARLSRVDAVHELKCVEGWSQIVHWGGYRFADFLTAFDLLPAPGTDAPYLLLSTPNEGYTAAIDLASALHPQTLLCDLMDGQPLAEGHGAPIRLVLPVKYGIKNIKWLSRIQFLPFRPFDYWTARGYDWYAGL
jgi:DMSO/TMAO reductase YedYZ molybdopterin-dependent catalytic subunit